MKITFNYGTMNSGKTTMLLGMYHNYCVAGKKPVLVKLSDATREKNIESRMGIKANGFLLSTDLDIDAFTHVFYDKIILVAIRQKSPILIDECQFLKAEQVEKICELAIKFDVEIIAFGLLTNFKGELFEGSKKWIEDATHIREIKTICSFCGKYKSNRNLMCDENDKPIFDLKGEIYPNAKYHAVCEKCYLKLIDKYSEKKWWKYWKGYVKNHPDML